MSLTVGGSSDEDRSHARQIGGDAERDLDKIRDGKQGQLQLWRKLYRQERTVEAESLLDRLADILTMQGFKIVKFLWHRKHSTTYDSLRSIKQCWQDRSAVTDEAIHKALKRIQQRLNTYPELQVTIEIANANRRVKLTRPDK